MGKTLTQEERLTNRLAILSDDDRTAVIGVQDKFKITIGVLITILLAGMIFVATPENNIVCVPVTVDLVKGCLHGADGVDYDFKDLGVNFAPTKDEMVDIVRARVAETNRTIAEMRKMIKGRNIDAATRAKLLNDLTDVPFVEPEEPVKANKEKADK